MVTPQLAQQLIDQGWNVVVLSFPPALVPRLMPLPEGVRRVRLEASSDAYIGQTLAAIASQAGSPAAFLHLHPGSSKNGINGLDLWSEAEAEIVKQVFFLAKHLKGSLTQAANLGRSAFLTVVRLDGAFGLGQWTDFSAIAGGLFGLTKTLSHEWPSVFCRAVDLSPDLTVGQAIQFILAELHDPDQALVEVANGPHGRVTLTAGTTP